MYVLLNRTCQFLHKSVQLHIRPLQPLYIVFIEGSGVGAIVLLPVLLGWVCNGVVLMSSLMKLHSKASGLVQASDQAEHSKHIDFQLSTSRASLKKGRERAGQGWMAYPIFLSMLTIHDDRRGLAMH